MNKFLIKSSIFFLPLVFWALLIIIVDPFNYFNKVGLISNKIKIENSRSINLLLYQSIKFNNSPNDHIIIGDSRTEILSREEIKSISGISYASLCNNAAKLNEIIDLIYMANEIKNLKHVVIGINFNMFNKFGYADRVKNVKKVLSNPIRYVYSKTVLEATYYILKSILYKNNVSSLPPMTKDEFWNWNLEVKATHWYSRYKYPLELIDKIKELDTFSLDNKIKLTFIIVPHNQEFHDRLIDYGLAENEKNFKSMMSQLNADVIDYDYKNEITFSKENFDDPVHYNSAIASIIINEIWSGKYIIGKKL